jgi:hypothetical protein
MKEAHALRTLLGFLKLAVVGYAFEPALSSPNTLEGMLDTVGAVASFRSSLRRAALFGR